MATQEEILQSLEQFLAEEERRNRGPQPALNPGHRRQFLWPKPSIAAQYNVKPEQFTREVRLEIHGEAFPVLVAETPFGVFGKCEPLWAEAKGSDEEAMIANLKKELEPLFERQFAISRTLGLPRRYDGAISDLEPPQLVRLLFCTDRDVAHQAMYQIESRARTVPYGPALIRVIEDRSHPYRRTAQWCALDVFEDLLNIFPERSDQQRAVDAICEFMMTAEDDYARAVFKAGDVLGDHVATEMAGEGLLRVLEEGESPFGRRSAVHGLIHLCEWLPEFRPRALAALERVSEKDPEPILRDYAAATMEDIRTGVPHGPEPTLPQEAA
ncbi:MAG: hypothetical protein KatS3mg015_0394 [Fimbriimonadales bacterium]|nr:MAG: hypothetical protein KatS3mg015_0394 [Fimbriimonadales bacterium]